MAATIHRFPLRTTDTQCVLLPAGSRPLSVAVRDDEMHLWALVELGEDLAGRLVTIVGTGHPMPDEPGEFLGTCLLHQGALVFHVFIGPEVL